jgi:hypothetical protein
MQRNEYELFMLKNNNTQPKMWKSEREHTGALADDDDDDDDDDDPRENNFIMCEVKVRIF